MREEESHPLAQQEDESRTDKPAAEKSSAPENAPEPESVPTKTPSEQVARYCPSCGTKNNADSRFCCKCGQPIAPSPNSERRKPKVNLKLVIPAGLLVIAVAVAAFILIPELTATPDDLILQGRYSDAYNRADDEQKSKVISAAIEAGLFETAYELSPDSAEEIVSAAISANQFETAYNISPEEAKNDVLISNLVAFLSRDIVDALKDPDSFKLEEAYFDDESHSLVLEVAGANSYGAKVSNWYLYFFNDDDSRFKLYTSTGDLDDEKIYDYLDDADEKLEKTLENAGRRIIRQIISNQDLELPKSYVDGINLLFESENGFENTELIGPIDRIYSDQATTDV